MISKIITFIIFLAVMIVSLYLAVMTIAIFSHNNWSRNDYVNTACYKMDWIKVSGTVPHLLQKETKKKGVATED